MELLQIYPVNECIGPIHTCMFVRFQLLEMNNVAIFLIVMTF